jgi:hypothetical protein
VALALAVALSLLGAEPNPCAASGWCQENPAVPFEVVNGFAGTATDLWAYTDKGLILHRQEARWVPLPRRVEERINSVLAFGPNDVWTITLWDIFHWDGDAWVRFEHSGTGWLGALAGSGPDDLWLLGAGGVQHFDGRRFQSVETPREQGDVLYAGDAYPGNVWAVGRHNGRLIVLHRDGEHWSREALPYVAEVGSVHADAHGVWIAGEHDVLHRVNGRWQRIDGITSASLALSRGPGGPVVIEEQGRVWRWEKDAFKELPPLVGYRPFAAWAWEGRSVWVGGSGPIVRIEGAGLR